MGQALAHERKVTDLISKLVVMATAAGDHATMAMLQWFVTEQVEEEKTARTILEEAQRIGPTSSAITSSIGILGRKRTIGRKKKEEKEA